MQLKTYQTETLETLSQFLQDSKFLNVETAFKKHAIDNEANMYAKQPYTPITDLENVPSVCIRIPTGGGKTILASYSVKIGAEFTEQEFPVVLWLVPTDTIRTQTVEALKNTDHPYRQVLDEQFGGTANVKIVDIGDYTHISAHDIHANAIIIVGTVQSLRVKDKQQRRLYAHNENLEPHFTHITPTQNMDFQENSTHIKYSFFNLMKLYRPIMILDEGHRFKSKLSEDVIQGLNPSLVLEFTATPKGKKNVLVSVPAITLRDEQMIKMPVKLAPATDWQGAVNGAVAKRHDLAQIAEQNGEKIRPIVLFQAENKDKSVNIEVLKEYLMETENIPPEKIAIATGDQRELDGINIMDTDCPITYIITVQALKEGWDCPYAYIFCSVANIQSSIDIEQLLGRVLRMPFATRRKSDDLNCAYAFVPENTQFAMSAQKLVDKLIDMGFEDSEAQDMIEQQPLLNTDPIDVFVDIPVSPDFKLEQLGIGADKYVKIIKTTEHSKTLQIIGVVPPEAQKIIAPQIVGDKQQQQDLTKCMELTSKRIAKQKSFALQGVPFGDIPQLLLDYGDGFLPVTPDVFIEAVQWDPFKYNHLAEFAITETTGEVYTIDIGDNKKVEIKKAEQHIQPLFVLSDSWDKRGLTQWVEKRLQKYAGGLLSQPVIVEYIRRNLDNLNKNIDIAILGRCRHQLLESLKQKLLATQHQSRSDAMQKYLFAKNAQVQGGNTFSFEKNTYNPPQQYHGNYQFNKHYYGVIASMNAEELRVAKFLDGHNKVKFWIRNLDKNIHAFKLPLFKNNFYPDFIAKLENGKLLVVEHKGADRFTADDSKAKKAIGEFWADKTHNIFFMTTSDNIEMPLDNIL